MTAGAPPNWVDYMALELLKVWGDQPGFAQPDRVIEVFEEFRKHMKDNPPHD